MMASYYRKCLVLCAAMLMAVLLAGCGHVVRSTAVNEGTYDCDTSGIAYHLPMAVIKVRAQKNSITKQYNNIELERLIVPDRSRIYVLQHVESITSDDILKIKVDGNGFLESIDSTTVDQTGKILEKIAELAREIAKMTVTGGVLTDRGGDLVDVEYLVTIDQLKSGMPFTLDDSLTIQMEVLSGMGAPQTDIPSFRDEVISRDDGVFYRKAYPCFFRIKCSNGSVVFVENIPDISPAFFLPVRRSLFVTRDTDVRFSNGMLTEMNVDKKSELLGAVTSLTEVVKSIGSIPFDIITQQIKYFTEQEKLTEAEKSYLDMLQQWMEKKEEVRLQKEKQREGPPPPQDGEGDIAIPEDIEG